MTKDRQISILQYNVMRSRTKVMAPLFRDRRTREFDIIALQEPWKNPFRDTTYHPLKREFELLHFNGPARTCIFVNKRIASSSWTVTYHTSDLCTLHLKLANNSNAGGAIHIYNIYNPPRTTRATSSLHALAEALRDHPTDQHIVLGDFNLHHPLWTGPEYSHQDREADELIDLLERFSLHLASPPAIPTFARNDAQTTIDLAFMTAGILEHLVKCQVRGDLQQDSDHIPISTVVDLSPPRRRTEARPNWKSTDTTKLKQTFEKNLPSAKPPRSVEALENLTGALIKAIKEAIEISTPPLRVSPQSMPGWTKECKEAQMETRRLRRIWQRTRSEDDWERYRSTRNKKGRLIQKALQQEHRTKIESAATKDSGIWRLAKWAQNREANQSSHMPALRRPDSTYAEQPKEKLDTLREAFFPEPPQADLSDMEGFIYPQETPWPDVTAEEVRLAMQRAKPWKAPGPDGIPNGILQQLGPALVPTLTTVYNASLRLGHCPGQFRQSITLALRKHKKDDYTDPKSYRPIALTNTVGKMLESIIARRMSYLVERFDLLPQSHIGGRRGRSTEHAVHLLVETVHSAWNSAEPRVATLLQLDVSGAYDNVSHPRLLHNLRKRRIGGRALEWIRSFLSERQTKLKLSDGAEACYDTPSGIPQGSPLSPMLYLFYNADLLETCAAQGVMVIGYIDDVNLLAVSSSTEENCRLLTEAHAQAERWAAMHASVFAVKKYELTHFTKTPARFDTEHGITLGGRYLSPSDSCRFLGVLLDQKLSGKTHVQQLQARATTTLAALSSIAGSTWGVPTLGLRQIYRSIILPRILYCCSIWAIGSQRSRSIEARLADTVEAIQYRAARIIAGAFRATSKAALDIELFLLPAAQVVKKHMGETLLRMASTPLYRQLVQLTERTWDSRKRDCPNTRGPMFRIRKHWNERLDGLLTNVEQRLPHLFPPWQKPANVCIAKSRELAISQHDQTRKDTDTLAIYTDGSAIDGHVGAAATAPAAKTRLTKYMGTIRATTVFAAELQGIVMALELAGAEMVHGKRKIAVFTDNQAALRALVTPGEQSGQRLLNSIIARLTGLQQKGASVGFRWIPAHQGVPGNEEADKLAKAAAREGRAAEHRTQPNPQTSLVAALKQAINQTVMDEWKQAWRDSERGRQLFKVAPEPSRKTLALHRGTPRALSSLIVQMRTGKIGLRHFLHQRRVPGMTSGECDCGCGLQTVSHVLYTCSKFDGLRLTFRMPDERGRRCWTADLRKLLSQRSTAIAAAKFMMATKLLGQFGATSRPQHEA